MYRLESFLEKLTNVERSITERPEDMSHEVLKARSQSTNNQMKKKIDKKFQGKCHKCGKKGHMQRLLIKAGEIGIIRKKEGKGKTKGSEKRD